MHALMELREIFQSHTKALYDTYKIEIGERSPEWGPMGRPYRGQERTVYRQLPPFDPHDCSIHLPKKRISSILTYWNQYAILPSMSDHRIRKSKSRGTPSYQLGHYEMSGDKGKRRSVFKVDVHLGEHPTAEDALSAWPLEIDHFRQIGRESKAEKLQAKLETLQELTRKGDYT